MQRVNISSSSRREDVFGYSRAVRAVRYVHVSGTAAFGPDGGIVGAGNVGAQTCRCLENIRVAPELLVEIGADALVSRVL